MVIGYSFQDEHINEVIERASRERGLGTYLVNPSGRAVLRDPKLAGAAIYVPRGVEDIRLIGEMRRPLSAVFDDRDSFGHGELMRFFS
jgi:carbamoylphosphate synthase large subunit